MVHGRLSRAAVVPQFLWQLLFPLGEARAQLLPDLSIVAAGGSSRGLQQVRAISWAGTRSQPQLPTSPTLTSPTIPASQVPARQVSTAPTELSSTMRPQGLAGRAEPQGWVDGYKLGVRGPSH